MRESGEGEERTLLLDLVDDDGTQTRLTLRVADAGGWVTVEQPELAIDSDCYSYFVVGVSESGAASGPETPPVTANGVPRLPLDGLASPIMDDELTKVVLRLCGPTVAFQDEALASYVTFIHRAAELREEPELLDPMSPAPRTSTWGRQITVKVWKPNQPLFELRPAGGDQAARVLVRATQTVATREMPDDCPLTIRGVRGLDTLPFMGGQGGGSEESGYRRTTTYQLDDVTKLEAIAAARRVRLRNCLGAVPLSDDTRAALGQMEARLDELTTTAE